MNIKLLLGIALFLIGLIAAVAGIAGVGEETRQEAAIIVEDNRSQSAPANSGKMIIPAIAALSLAVGGLLIGLSFGNWKNPRTHHEPGDEVVDPEGYHKMKHV